MEISLESRNCFRRTGVTLSNRHPPRETTIIEVSGPYTIQTDSFRFTETFTGLEVIEKAGTVIGYDGESEVTTPYDSCVLIMPSLRQTPGGSAVRF